MLEVPTEISEEVANLLNPAMRVAILVAVARDQKGNLFPYFNSSYPLPEQDEWEVQDFLKLQMDLSLEDQRARLESNTTKFIMLDSRM